MEKTLELAYIIVGDECGSVVQRICSSAHVLYVIQTIKAEESRQYELHLAEEARKLLEYSQSLSPDDFDYNRWGNIQTLEDAKDDVRARWEGDRTNHWSGNFRYAQKVIAKKGVRIYTKHRIYF